MNSPIVHFSFFSSNTPSAFSYGIWISQLMRYARACSHYIVFINIHKTVRTKLLERLTSNRHIIRLTFIITNKLTDMIDVCLNLLATKRYKDPRPLYIIVNESGLLFHRLHPTSDCNFLKVWIPMAGNADLVDSSGYVSCNSIRVLFCYLDFDFILRLFFFYFPVLDNFIVAQKKTFERLNLNIIN